MRIVAYIKQCYVHHSWIVINLKLVPDMTAESSALITQSSGHYNAHDHFLHDRIEVQRILMFCSHSKFVSVVAFSVQLRTVSWAFGNEIFLFFKSCYWMLSESWRLIMIMKLKANSSTFIIWNYKPQIFNQLGGIIVISHALWNTVCCFPELFQPDFGNLNQTKVN